MSIAEFITERVLRPRLQKSGCLVVYDTDSRFRDQCFDLENDNVRVVDTTESGIGSREAALNALREIGQQKSALEGLVIYVPQTRPDTDEQKQLDPFSFYAACGAVFPKDDGDEFLSICLRAKPDHATEIRQVFANAPSGPSFAVIDAIGGGMGWPQLRATLKVESARELLSALLSPNSEQLSALKKHEGWMTEAHQFLQAALAMSVKTKSKTWSTLADEIWRYVLFSEFVFDLPSALPESLHIVPRAPIEAKPIIEDVCEDLRNRSKSRGSYIERAEAIEADLNLAELCSAIEDLGERDTFPFEERTFLQLAIKGITGDGIDTARRVLNSRRDSIWLEKGESRAQWELIRAGLNLLETCDDLERQLPGHSRSQATLIDFYVGSLREADRLQREFEQAAGDFQDQDALMFNVIRQARARYRKLFETVQDVFVKHLEQSGWPPTGRLANSSVFDLVVADQLKESGRRVAYIMVDALRYELGLALEKMLSEDGPVELRAAYAQLPTITQVGMASLLPGANANLRLANDKEALLPTLDGVPVGNVSQRMNVLSKRYGDRFAEMLLHKFANGKPKIEEKVDLLVLRSTEIDSQLESNPETTLGLIPNTLKLIRVALHKLRGMGFKQAVIVTDHGFFLNAHAEAGDVCTKPQGDWPINAHDRMMLGAGQSDNHSLVLSAEKVGIRGDISQVAIPRSMAPYRNGHLYFHGGASLSEAVVPVLTVNLSSSQKSEISRVLIELSYKNGAGRITTRMPVFDVLLAEQDMFSQGKRVEILVEAHDVKGNVVGEPRSGGDVNPATRTITLEPGQPKKIVLRMDDEFRGKFTLIALNPVTLASFHTLSLETDYTE